MKPRTFLTCVCAFACLTAAPLFPQQVRYGTGSWDAETLGNHRAVLRVAEKAEVDWAHIPWRRRDLEPEKKNIIVSDDAGKRVSNLIRVNVNRSYGDILFQALNPGTYYVYYLPYVSKGRNYPVVTYPAPENSADPGWQKIAQAATLRSDRPVPQASLVEIQAIDEFNSFYPMEVIATPEEIRRLLAVNTGKRFLLFPEDRRYPIRMTEDLPQKWIVEGPRQEVAGEALRGEFYAFQIGLYASSADIQDIGIRVTDLRDASRSIPASHCINTGGMNWDGRTFKKAVAVKKGQVQALWFGI